MSLFIAKRPPIERVVLVPNHTPASHKLAEQCRDDIAERLGKAVIIQPTVDGGRENNTELFSNVLREGDIVGGVFGDGTFRDVALAIGKTPIISLAGGNARDIGRATHRKFENAPSELIRRSVAVSAFALACTIRSGDDTRRLHALSYIGCGETALGSERLAEPNYRDREPGWYRDFDLGMESLRSDFYFHMRNRAEERKLSDLTFAKGSRMAKIGRFPVDHWEDVFRVTPMGANPASKLAVIAGMAGGLAFGENFKQYDFVPLTPTYMHFDGEPPINIVPESEIRVELGEEYTLMTSRLRESV